MNEPCSCGRGCDCGCCEGTEPLTPQAVANRPGLDALSYRAGTHATFLETMKARLSSQALPALAGLTTREPADASLALLDAWAVVADVLTFYQERLANEGYLRTATERRSVLELARLVGYVPRPGVAASTYLAYTLDEGPETVIPAGAAAKTVPGPGEKPQTFETSDDLVARAAWNSLQIRLTQPQQPRKLAKDWRGDPRAVPLYFKGITTNLKPNDPLLIQTGEPNLYRVLKVEPDAANDRTRVEVELWLPPPPIITEIAAPPLAEAPRETGVSARELRETLEYASDLETLKISRGAIARRVLSHLEPVKAALAAGAGEPELRAAIEEALPKLREEHGVAVEKNANRLQPWIHGVMENLESAAAGSRVASAAAPASAAPEPAPELREISTSDDGPATTGLPNVLGSLGKPPQPQVRSAAHLDRDPQKLFSLESDLLPRLLTEARPELAGSLYQAWASLPATEDPVLKVCALRTRASAFGHNAPRKPVRNDAGIITGTEEWDLSLSAGSDETFGIGLIIQSGSGVLFQVSVELGGVSADTPPFQPSNGQSVTLESPDPHETVVLTATQAPQPGQGSLPLELKITFEKREVQIFIVGRSVQGGNSQGQIEYQVSSSGGPMTEVLLSFGYYLSQGVSEIDVRGGIRAKPGDLESPYVIFLDNAYPQVLPGGWIVLQRPAPGSNTSTLVIATAAEVSEESRTAYGISGKTTRVVLDKPWLMTSDTFEVIRRTAVYAQCEELELAEEPIDQPVDAVDAVVTQGLCGGKVELARLYDGLQPGRWLIFSGERTDVVGEDGEGNTVPVSGVPGVELAMVAGIEQGVSRISNGSEDGGEIDLPGDRIHTTLTLAKPLAYCYKRDTLKIYGNVVKATHGETRFEVMGGGDASKPNQSFTLKQPPLTWVSAPTPSGIESTLQTRVNDILWHKADCPVGLGPADRRYFVRIDDGGQTTVVFGDGKHGARLPTGSENVRAAYRSGIGKEGNVKAGQISQLATRPLGVKDVINPIPATGGAGPESRDQARRNAPLAVMALDRLVSVQDYADFARTFAGVGKTSATRISDGRVELVHVTIAGEDDIPIREDSDLFLNLEDALLRFGEPRQPLALAVRRRFFLVVQADVRLLPDYLWEKVESQVRAAMVETFSFVHRDLGQDALLSEVYRTMQGVPGVDYVDVNLFTKHDPENLEEPLDLTDQPRKRLPASLARIEDGKIQPAQLLYLTPAVADTLILKERKS